MSDFTIEQLEALKEGTTEGPWEASVQSFAENEGGAYSLYAEVADKDGVPLMYAEDAFVFHREPNFTLAAAAPALVDALIAEKQAHAELRAEVEAMREDWGRKAERSAGARDNSEHPAKAAHARHLKAHQHVIRRITRILEADNE